MYIAIAGNIGSGKTTLTELLARKCGLQAYYEEGGNPYIGDFYQDMNRWSFNLQIYFLGSRIRRAAEFLSKGKGLVQDRTVYEDAYIFADNLHTMGLMASRDYETYMGIFDIASKLIPQPDLLIWLKASVPTLVKLIRKRGRDYEAGIMEEYLERLNQKYQHWIDNIYRGRVITVDVDNTDFTAEPEKLHDLVEQIMKFGK
ncbi:MAG: deoxynucleoside kinase [Rikenellaceae bacterium]|jgi:deoxyadenosine/deoxycytidine kinase|nr:deoxynucleoside kinase [Rikenellaceae bacterium]